MGIDLQCGECLECWLRPGAQLYFEQVYQQANFACSNSRELNSGNLPDCFLRDQWHDVMGLNYWKRGKLCIECKHFTSNIKYCIFRLRPFGGAARQCWAKYFLKLSLSLSLSPQICWPHVSRVSKVHRLPDLRSVYPRSSGNNNNLYNQPVLGEVWGVTLAQVYNSRLWRDWYLGWGSCSATHEEKSWIQNSPAITSSWTTLLGAPHHRRHTETRRLLNRRALKHKNNVKTKQPNE